jgi:histidine ammonia-lyase
MLGQSIDPSHCYLERIHHLLQSGERIFLSDEAKASIQKGRNYLDERLAKSDAPIYGINTGFGSLCDVQISHDQLEQLQENLVKSHACGQGEPVPPAIVKAMLLLKVQSLTYGLSGVQEITVQRLIDFYNENVLPVVYQQGSLGASGDLAPLAHLCLPLLGLGEVWVNGIRQPAASVLERFGWEPIKLQSKEGLALLNGTQFMNAYGVSLSAEAMRLFNWATVIACISIDAFDGRPDPFHPRIHEIRHHHGQQVIAATVRRVLDESEILKQEKAHVQDPYSFRCIPQVLGASFDVLRHAQSVFTNELNAVTDNPTIFPDEDLIISGGNFHGQPLAMALDYLCLAMHEVGSISERRTYQLIGGKRGLPPFLIAKPGLNSGLMIPQYTQASIVSQNKHLCMPASADTIDSSNGQEDHVSMGANAATKAWRVMENLEKILAIELLNAAQAMEFRRPKKSSAIIEELLIAYRKVVPFVDEDRLLYTDIENSRLFLKNHHLPLFI